MSNKERSLESLRTTLQEITPHDLQDFSLATQAGGIVQLYKQLPAEFVVNGFCHALRTKLTKSPSENERKKKNDKAELITFGLTWLGFKKEIRDDITALMHPPQPTEEEKNLAEQFDSFVTHMSRLYEQIKKKHR